MTNTIEIQTNKRMRTVKLNCLQELFVSDLPENVSKSPSMMSQEEKSFLYGLAKDYYCGKGLIVDAGAFLGGSTVCFGEGLRRNPKLTVAQSLDSKPIKTYERAQTGSNMTKFFERNGIQTDIVAGQSFDPLLRQFIQPVIDLVELNIGDITLAPWSQDKKIEILFLDVLKHPDINSYVLKTFMPYLIPGHSIVVQQDYFFDGLPFIKVTQEALDPYFEYIGEICSTAIFRLKNHIPQEVFTNDPYKTLPIEKQLMLIDQSFERTIDITRKFFVALSKVRLIGTHFGKNAANIELNKVKVTYPEFIHESALPRLKLAYKNTLTFIDAL